MFHELSLPLFDLNKEGMKHTVNLLNHSIEIYVIPFNNASCSIKYYEYFYNYTKVQCIIQTK